MKSALGHKNHSFIKNLGSKQNHQSSSSLGEKGSSISHYAGSGSVGSPVLEVDGLNNITSGTNSVNTQHMPLGLSKSHIEKR